MKISEADILIIPGLGGAEEGHWVRRWARQMSSARIVEQADFNTPQLQDWSKEIRQAVDAADRPVVLVAHSLGVVAAAHTAPDLDADKVAGAFFVAPSNWDVEGLAPEFDGADFRPVRKDRLPFPSQVIASRNDPYCTFEAAQDMAVHWGAGLIDAGEAGHINLESGQGPWPEGLTAFALFMKTL